MLNKALNHTSPKLITLRARAGAEIGACVREAVALAAQQACDVAVIHNGKTRTVLYDRLMSTVADEEATPSE